MKMARWLLLMALIISVAAAEGAVLPAGTKTVRTGAFAETAIFSLTVPAGCEALEENILTDAAYVRLNGLTALPETLGAAWIFGPGEHPQANRADYVPVEELLEADGLIFRQGEGGLTLLCAAQDALGNVQVPKSVGGVPVTAVSEKADAGLRSAVLCVPSYLTMPEELHATTYQALTAGILLPEMTMVNETITAQAGVDGAFGEAVYCWEAALGETRLTSEEASPTFLLPETGDWVITLTVTDELGDTFTTTSRLTVTPDWGGVTYRAYLIGNTYPDSDLTLNGCDTDMTSMGVMLASMTRTPYSIRRAQNITADRMLAGIETAFSGADGNDVSLFYFSGHGSGNGSLVGISNTLLSPGTLRQALDAVPGTKIVILDCCYSGQMIEKSGATTPSGFNAAVIDAFAFQERTLLNKAGYHVLTACRGDQRSSSLTATDISFGAFTYGVCYGSGWDEWNQIVTDLHADTNQDGAITLAECRATAAQRVAWLNVLAGGILNQDVQTYSEDPNFIFWAK